MRTEIDLMAGGFDVMPQIQIRREDGQVTCQRPLMLRQGALPFAAGAGAGAAAAAVAAGAAATAAAASAAAAAARRGGVL